jgi:hypothetical protein
MTAFLNTGSHLAPWDAPVFYPCPYFAVPVSNAWNIADDGVDAFYPVAFVTKRAAVAVIRRIHKPRLVG